MLRDRTGRVGSVSCGPVWMSSRVSRVNRVRIPAVAVWPECPRGRDRQWPVKLPPWPSRGSLPASPQATGRSRAEARQAGRWYLPTAATSWGRVATCRSRRGRFRVGTPGQGPNRSVRGSAPNVRPRSGPGLLLACGPSIGSPCVSSRDGFPGWLRPSVLSASLFLSTFAFRHVTI